MGLACNASNATFDEGASPDENPGQPGGGDPTFGTNERDGAVPKSPLKGNPVCRATSGTCMPDDDGTVATKDPDACDRVSEDAGASADLKACRVKAGGEPSCQAIHALGTDGAKCNSAAECAPGFDCVESDQSGLCRRYCCLGSCANAPSHNGSPTFCDVQKLVGGGRKGPVCMPLKSCKLLASGECADDETCGVVNEKGDTGCVANGTANAGKNCDEEHCAVGLTCLGAPGSRKCYQLCKLDNSVPCGPTQKCVTSVIFQDSGFGVCKDADQYSP